MEPWRRSALPLRLSFLISLPLLEPERQRNKKTLSSLYAVRHHGSNLPLKPGGATKAGAGFGNILSLVVLGEWFWYNVSGFLAQQWDKVNEQYLYLLLCRNK